MSPYEITIAAGTATFWTNFGTDHYAGYGISMMQFFLDDGV